MINAEPRELRCNACGAKLHYEAGAAVLTCAHCGTEYALETPFEGVIEFSLESAEAEAEAPALAEPERRSCDEEALSWLREGKKEYAVKIVRAHTGMGLRECEKYVEELAAGEGIPRRAGGRGPWLMVAVALIFVAITGVVAFLILAR